MEAVQIAALTAHVSFLQLETVRSFAALPQTLKR